MHKFFTTKKIRQTKICFALSIILFLVYESSFARSSDSQILDKEISINIREVSFEQMLTELSAIAKVKFAYSIDQLKIEERVSLQAEKRTLRDILEELLTPRNIKYKVHEVDATISLRRVVEKVERDQSSRINDGNAIHKERVLIQITGVVKDAKEQPLPGVNIVVKGSVNGTSSDAEGKYVINVEERDVLVFSFIGYASQEIAVSKQTTIDVVLVEDIQSLSEVVVNAGYWEVKDIERTGNISRITAETIEKQPVNNPLQAMQGRMPGVYIQQNSGVPGSSFKIQIRGQNSLRLEGNDPLYIIDGVPFTSHSLNSTFISASIVQQGNPLASINPNDIASIEVLKDADATAIYGSRGANGVVLITTKKGKAEKTSFNFNISQGIGQVANELELLNSPQYTQMRLEAVNNGGFGAFLANPAFDSFWPDLKVWDTTRYTNWQKELIGGTSNITNAQLSLTGGSSNTQFYFTGGYYRETTVFPGDFAFQRMSGILGINHTSKNKKFTLAISTNYSKTINNLNSLDLTNQAMTVPPTAPALYTSTGEINWDWPGSTLQNPAAALLRKYESITQNSIANALLAYEVLPGLKLKTNMGFNTMLIDESSQNPISAKAPNPSNTASAAHGIGQLNTWLVEPQLEYIKAIGDGKISGMVGGSLQQTTQEGQTLEATGYTSDALLDNLMAAKQQRIINMNSYQYRYAAFFGRINYSHRDKYFINLTGRRDGSSKFGKENQYGNFGAIGAAWIFSRENWFQNFTILSMGKLRMSYGITGSDNIGNYQYLDTYSTTTYPYNNTSGLIVTRLSNPDYSWETNKKFEIGLEVGLLKDRLTFAVSFYDNRSSNQLVGLPLPLTTGQSSVQYNFPATVQNKGTEVTLNSLNINKSNFSWNTDFNISFPKNVILEFPDLESFPAYKDRYQVGESIYTAKYLHATGVDPETGIYTFRDADGNGAIEYPKDGLFQNEVTQHWFGGMNNSFAFKGFQIDIFLQFVSQTGRNYRSYYSMPGLMSNQPIYVLNRWQQSGNITDTQMFTLANEGNSAYNRALFSDLAISDASFARIKNISINYQFPVNWVQSVKIQSAKIYINGQNLYTFTKYQGADPENQAIGYLPPLRTITIGFQLTL